MAKRRITAVRIGMALQPVGEDAREVFRALSPGVIVMMDVSQKRNVRQHRLYWLLIGKVHDSLPEGLDEKFPNKESLSDAIKVAVGHFETRYTFQPTGNGKDYSLVEHVVAKSIAFDAMGQEDFGEFFKAAVQAVCSFVLVDLEAEALLLEIEKSIY